MTNNRVGSNGHTPIEPQTTRKALAEISGTSQGTMQRVETIVTKGTPEQISRGEISPVLFHRNGNTTEKYHENKI